MKKSLINIRQFRVYLLNQVKNLSNSRLNDVPEEFHNNVIWNMGHMIAVQQAVCYLRSGLDKTMHEETFRAFLPGTRPDGIFNSEEIRIIKTQFIESIDELTKHIHDDMFQNYSPVNKIYEVYGVEVASIEDAVYYLQYHDGYHAGVISSLMHFV